MKEKKQKNRTHFLAMPCVKAPPVAILSHQITGAQRCSCQKCKMQSFPGCKPIPMHHILNSAHGCYILTITLTGHEV